MHWKDLEVWKQAHSLVLVAYRLSNSFPECERYRLTSQLCRAAVSVPANIVEGNARGSTKEYIQFLIMARGSLEETRYFALLGNELGYLNASDYDQFEDRCESVSRMLNGLLRALRSKGPRRLA
ncbi:MAG: four helix bundle protein [Nitrospirae bacterium]|nr:MAG: four helix bundle protein [Nitrospirota bacterium]